MDIKDFIDFLKDSLFEFFHEYVKVRDERDNLRTQVVSLEMTIQDMRSERNLYPYKLEDKDKKIAELRQIVKGLEMRLDELENVCLTTIGYLPRQLILYRVKGRAIHAWSEGNTGFPVHARVLAGHDDVQEVAYYVQQDWKEEEDEGDKQESGRS